MLDLLSLQFRFLGAYRGPWWYAVHRWLCTRLWCGLPGTLLHYHCVLCGVWDRSFVEVRQDIVEVIWGLVAFLEERDNEVSGVGVYEGHELLVALP